MASYSMPKHDSQAVLNILRKRGEDSAAFFAPFLRREMALVDIGCGPGSITAVLAAKVRSTIGVDNNLAAIRRGGSEVRCVDHHALQFVVADMMALPFDANAFDAAFCHSVLYHLDAPTVRDTLREIQRVLKPGGYIGIRDAEFGRNIVYPEEERLTKALDLWMRWYRHDNPKAGYCGHHQGAVLRANGFTPIWSGASFETLSANSATREETAAQQKEYLESIRQVLIDDHLASYTEFDDALSAWESWLRYPDAMYLRCRCEYVAVKGSGSD